MHHWAARSTGGEFTPGSEADELIWPVPRRDEQARLRPGSKSPVLCLLNTRNTQTVLVVRHGTAGSKRTSLGRQQATASQEGSCAGRSVGAITAGVRRHRCLCADRALPPDDGATRRGTEHDHTQRAHS